MNLPNNTLRIGQEKRRGHKFGIYAGDVCLGRFKTQEAAEKDLEKQFDLYKWWSQSISVSVQNTKATVIWC